MSSSHLLNELIQALRCLPGVGQKSAQRMALSLLESDRQQAKQLAHSLLQAVDNIKYCASCRNFSDHTFCDLCQNTKRDPQILCIVETPADVLAIEQTAAYKGLYFILLGRLSPLDGIGPEDLGLNHLLDRCKKDDIKEVILATNFTTEGEATAHYIHQLLASTSIKISRIAYGVPVGSELEYVDGNTLARALNTRSLILKNHEDIH